MRQGKYVVVDGKFIHVDDMIGVRHWILYLAICAVSAWVVYSYYTEV